MTVYLLWSGSYDDRDVESVFADLETAMAHSHGHRPKWSEVSPGRWHCEWTLRHHRAQVPIDIHYDTLTVPVVDGKATLPDGRVVDSTSAFVVVPVLPPGTVVVPAEDWTDDCNIVIEARVMASA